jgi:signal transduction histidine kinase
MGMRARELVTALDEIVWAMNPQHDSLASLVSYFSLYAERFLALSHMAWTLDAPPGPEHLAIDSRRRHQLFLAFKEALTNAVRHSGAAEVHLKIHSENGHLLLEVTDNGRGFSPAEPAQGRDGNPNMRARIEKLGGEFHIHSVPGRGTTVRLRVPSA